MVRSLRAIFILTILVILSLLAAGQEATRGGRRRGDGQGSRIFGTVASIQADSITVNTRESRVVVKVTSDTQFRRDRQPAKLTDFKPGDRVLVAGDPTKDGMVARLVASGTRPDHPPTGEEMARMGLGKEFIAGEVKSINETKLTILRPDGQTQVIEVDENTSFRNDKGESVTLAEVKIGDRVAGRGELKNGVFVPRVLRVGVEFPGNRRPAATQ